MEMVFNITKGYIQSVHGYYDWIMSLSHPSTKGLPLVDSPVEVIFTVLVYLVAVLIGPKMMKNRKAFKLNWVLIPYNLVLAALNLYMFFKILTTSVRIRYNYICHACGEATTPGETQMIHLLWLYYISKVVEFADTIFFILKKKERQLTFLHIYHHSSMLVITWIGMKWVPCGLSSLGALINSGIHVLMYTYYGLSALGPRLTKYLWWKKYLTILQLIQFTTGVFLCINGLIIRCDYPIWMHYAAMSYMLSYIVLFGNFYIQAYREKGNKIFYGIDTGCGQGMFDETGKLISYNSVQSENQPLEDKKSL